MLSSEELQWLAGPHAGHRRPGLVVAAQSTFIDGIVAHFNGTRIRLAGRKCDGRSSMEYLKGSFVRNKSARPV